MTATTPILAPAHLPVLAGLALSRVMLAFDYDGTLAPIADRPEQAHMRSSTRRLLAEVSRVYPTVVISGRALRDVTSMLGRVPLWSVYGNHGLEPLHPQAAATTRGWVAHLRQRLPEALGVRIEDKGYSLTLHFRGAPDRAQALAAVESAITALPDVLVVHGNEAINVLPRGLGNKGTALTEAMETFACERAIFVGDEETDEAAFAAGGTRAVGIRVGASAASHAQYHLASQRDIDRLLLVLLDFRRLPLHPD